MSRGSHLPSLTRFLTTASIGVGYFVALGWGISLEYGAAPLPIIVAVLVVVLAVFFMSIVVAARTALMSGDSGLKLQLSSLFLLFAVAAFLERRIGFLEIATFVAEVLEQTPAGPASHLDDVMAADAAARRAAEAVIARRQAA